MITVTVFVVAALLSTTRAYGGTELVMREGVTIEARKDNTSVKVTSGKGFDRTYEWGRCKLKSNMGARKQRWYGSMGIYDAAPSFGFSFGGCDGSPCWAATSRRATSFWFGRHFVPHSTSAERFSEVDWHKEAIGTSPEVATFVDAQPSSRRQRATGTRCW